MRAATRPFQAGRRRWTFGAAHLLLCWFRLEVARCGAAVREAFRAAGVFGTSDEIAGYDDEQLTDFPDRMRRRPASQPGMPARKSSIAVLSPWDATSSLGHFIRVPKGPSRTPCWSSIEKSCRSADSRGRVTCEGQGRGNSTGESSSQHSETPRHLTPRRLNVGRRTAQGNGPRKAKRS